MKAGLSTMAGIRYVEDIEGILSGLFLRLVSWALGFEIEFRHTCQTDLLIMRFRTSYNWLVGTLRFFFVRLGRKGGTLWLFDTG
jgi:hypothetical protein